MENRDFRLNKILKELNISFIEAAFVLKNNLNLGIFSNSISQRITEEQLNALVEYKKERNEPPSANGFKIIINQQTGLCELSVNTSKFIYGNGFISFNYNGECYNCPIKSISPKLNQYKDGIYRNFHTVNVRVINKKKRGCRQFYFTKKYFSNYLTYLSERCKKERQKVILKDNTTIHIPKKKNNSPDKETDNLTAEHTKITHQKIIKEQLLQSENLEFFDYHYKIWVIDNNRVKCRDITPTVIRDENSRACLNILNKYFTNRLPRNIFIQYSNERVVAVDKRPILSAYIKILKENVSIHGDWEYELYNYRKRTLDDCKKIPRKNVYKDASYKSIYIDYLASNQSNKQLIKAYEVFNGIEEDCFIFTIKMKDDLSAIVFENVLFARASEVFVVHEQEYEKSVNLIFNYFTDYELKQKRLAIKRKLIKAENFNAIKYVSIDHDKFPTWINKIQDVISSVKIQQGNIQFVHGLRISKDVSLRSSHKATTNISHIHKDLMLKLFFKLARKYGKENVGTEICVGKKRIDMAVKFDDKYDIYEIKSDSDVRTCIRQAIGQIFDYAYYGCSDNIGKMVIIGPSPITDEADKYLSNMRNQHKINIYYESI